MCVYLVFFNKEKTKTKKPIFPSTSWLEKKLKVRHAHVYKTQQYKKNEEWKAGTFPTPSPTPKGNHY